jgi:hypothetical protein
MRIRPPLNATYDLGEEYPDDQFNSRGYLNEKGFPKLCRLEFKLTTLTELKQCAVNISELNAKLNEIAFEDQRPDLARIFHARAALAECQHHLKNITSRQYKDARKYKGVVLGGKRQRDPRSSVPALTGIGKLNGRWLSDVANEKQVKAVETKGEKNETQD